MIIPGRRDLLSSLKITVSTKYNTGHLWEVMDYGLFFFLTFLFFLKFSTVNMYYLNNRESMIFQRKHIFKY